MECSTRLIQGISNEGCSQFTVSQFVMLSTKCKNVDRMNESLIVAFIAYWVQLFSYTGIQNTNTKRP